MLMSSDLIDHNELSWYAREFFFLGGGLGWDPELLSLDGVFSHDAKIFASLFCDILGSPGRCR
jgi:hypothetical protein